MQSSLEPVTASEPRLVEIGWVLAGRLDDADARAARRARERLLDWLSQAFPDFSFSMPVVARKEALKGRPAEPMTLLDVGLAERDAGHWDFALVITDAEIRSYEKRFALGVPASAMAVAVASTARLDPAVIDSEAADADRIETMARRLLPLVMHLLGHLNQLQHAAEAGDFMYDLTDVADLDGMQTLSEQAREELAERLKGVADLRLEEQPHDRSAPSFYLRASWLNRREIVSAIRRMQPWLFPFRLSKLTTPAVSTMVVLLVTAEAWEVGTSQRTWAVITLSLLSLVLASSFVLIRQKVLAWRSGRGLSEHRVMSNVAGALGIALGMATTYVLLFAVTLLAAQLLFAPRVISGWTASVAAELAFVHYLRLSGFVAALGLAIGALGASFEEQRYFRHVALADEET